MRTDEKRRLFDAVVWTFSAMFLVVFLVHESHRGLASAPAPAAPACKSAPAQPPSPAARSYLSQCGDCHIAYPARMLPATSWRRLMGTLDAHFGQDASLEPGQRLLIEQYLIAGARKPRADDPSSGPPRITTMRWWRRQHDRIRAQRWTQANIPSRAACESCHLNAVEGRFGKVRIPKAPAP
ncbi:MAG: hypothetical protein U1F26_07770 [Lysobacterales bacterium]